MDRSRTYYLAGPMSGIPKFNFPAFQAAAALLRDRGYKIISPAELDDPVTVAEALASTDGNPTGQKQSWGDFLARDVKIIADQVQGIILMPGWRASRGAKLEAVVGLLCGHLFGYYTDKGLYSVLEPLPSADVRHMLGVSL